MMKLANPNARAGANRNIISVPCMVSSWLYCSLDTNCRPGRASSVRITSAINPARMKKKNAVQVYMTPMVLWFVVVT